jgi:hypothetical protein
LSGARFVLDFVLRGWVACNLFIHCRTMQAIAASS